MSQRGPTQDESKLCDVEDAIAAALIEHRLDDLQYLLSQLSPVTQGQLAQQAISFAYGNCHLDNPNVTREMVEAAYRKGAYRNG